jgi:hypothetical protein
MPWVGGTWWELSLAQGWAAQDDPECLSLTKSDDGGAFQLSAAVKSQGPIQQEEIKEFYQSRVPTQSKLQQASFGSFQGFVAHYIEDEAIWYKFWLANGSLLVFATYNGTEDAWMAEKDDIYAMLGSLRLRQDQNALPA